MTTEIFWCMFLFLPKFIMPFKSKLSKSTSKLSALAMTTLSRDVEKSMAKGYDYVIGLDEAGRGPLAGPVVAAACYIPYDVEAIAGIHDSKALTEDDREAAYAVLTSNPRIFYGVSVVSHTEIDEINILQASLTGMARAAKELLEKFHASFSVPDEGKSKKGRSVKDSAAAPSLDKFIALVDGNKIPQDLTIASEYVIKGDSRIYSIAAASIIAKVTRDRIMTELDIKYPVYRFAKHKGYPTAEHRSLLIQHGPCEVHRVTYAPVRKALEIHGHSATTPHKTEGIIEETKAAKQKNSAKSTKKSSTTKVVPKDSEENSNPKKIIASTMTKTKKNSKTTPAHESTSETKVEDPTPSKESHKRKQLSTADEVVETQEEVVEAAVPAVKKQRPSSKTSSVTTTPVPEGVRRSSRIAAK